MYATIMLFVINIFVIIYAFEKLGYLQRYWIRTEPIHIVMCP